MNQSCRDIYLDANATTKVLPEAARAALETMEDLFGNPSSSHVAGLRARNILNHARQSALRVLGAEQGRIVFTSGATEAIQTAIFSAMCAMRERDQQSPSHGRCCLYSATEHKAVPQALHHWVEILGLKREIIAIPVNEEGELDIDFLAKHAARADLICTMAVNNETGVIHDLAQIETTIRSANPEALWLVDCVQAIAKLELNLAATSIDYAAASGHKLYAPKGIGLLYVRQDAPLKALLAGGGQEGGARAGTENLPGVAAIATVFEAIEQGKFHPHESLVKLRDCLVKSLRSAFPNIVFNTPFEHSVATTINFSVHGLSSKELLDLFDAADMRVSSGSACGSALVGSYVLEAMGLPQWRCDGAIRLSFGPLTTAFEIKNACCRIEEAGRALRRSCLMLHDDDQALAEPMNGLIQLKSGSMCSWIYIDAQSATAIIVDPFAELADRIETIIRCQNCTVLAILDSHLHVDHESCRNELIERLDKQLDPAARSDDPLGWPAPTGSVKLATGLIAPTFPIGEHDVLAWVNLPGHTTVGCALLLGTPELGELPPDKVRFAFTGDTILIGGIGRTDFHSSSMGSLYHSIRSLDKLLSPLTILCPTHDYTNGFATTLEAEQRQNPFLRQLLDPVMPMDPEEFARRKPGLDEGIDDESNSELICGKIAAPCAYKTSLEVAPEDRHTFFKQHRNALVIDVREPHEFRFVHNWTDLGLLETPLNVPLTRFAHYLHSLLTDHPDRSQLEVICLCRSGARSKKIAEVLQRCGIEHTWDLSGGLALGTSSYLQETDTEYSI